MGRNILQYGILDCSDFKENDDGCSKTFIRVTTKLLITTLERVD